MQGDKYRIIDVLGQGGFGITYLAEQVMAERKVCIKEFFPKEYYKRDEDSHSISLGTQGSAEIMDLYKAKFVKEAKTIAKLDHPNIIHIFDVFTENNTAYYVMEYIEGESLSDVVKRNGSALAEGVAVDYIKQAASALGYIHERKIMHLDVKPANIMLRKEDGRPILIDFGLSKQYDAEGNQTSSTPVGISAGFAPMEQYQQGGVKEFSPETDIYSLGASLYYLVTGCVPPQAAAIVDDGLPELPAHLSANVRKAIERSMEVQRKRRPHSMDEFVALLDDSKKVVPIIPTPQSESTVIAAASANIPDESTKLGEAPTPTPKAEAPKKEWTPKYSTEKPKKSDDEKSNKRWLIWLLGLLLIICGVYFIIGANSGDNSDEKRSNAPREERNDNVQREESANAELEVTSTAEAAEAMAEIDNSEETRLAEEEAARQAEQQRLVEEEAERQRIAEQKKKEEAARKAEQQRLAEEEAARQAEQQRIDNMVANGLGRDGVYQIGDYYNRNGKRGVVFAVWDNGRHGKIVSLDDTKLQWCTGKQWGKRIDLGLTDESDGKANTDKVMKRSDSDQYPAFVWCRKKGANWHLPAKEELMAIHNNYSAINSTLAEYGTQLTDEWHWSSTDYDEDHAWVVSMTNGFTYDFTTFDDFYVRAVSAF